jgi:methyl-accepting chemotaxis protein
MSWGIWHRWQRYSNRLSMKGRIGLGIAASRLIFLPVIILAIYYIAGMLSATDRIAKVTARTAGLADQVILEIREIRKVENDLLLLKDPLYLRSIKERVNHLNDHLENALQVDSRQKEQFLNLRNKVKDYSDRIESLAQSAGPALNLSSGGRFASMVNEYRNLLDHMLEAARHSKSPEEVSRSIVEISNSSLHFDRFIVRSLLSRDPQRAILFENLRNRGQEIENLAGQISAEGWKRVEEERIETENLGNRARYLITIALVLTLILSFLFTWYLPKRVLHPLRQVTQALRKASTGNYDVILHLSAKDELGELVNEFHNLIEHMRDKQNGKSAVPDLGNSLQESKPTRSYTEV